MRQFAAAAAATALNTPTQAITSDMIKMDISPTKGERAAAGKDKRTADKGTVQEWNVHSSEEYLFVFKLEAFIVEVVKSRADHPSEILVNAKGDPQDVVKTLHSLKKLYKSLKVGNPGHHLKRLHSWSH